MTYIGDRGKLTSAARDARKRRRPLGRALARARLRGRKALRRRVEAEERRQADGRLRGLGRVRLGGRPAGRQAAWLSEADLMREGARSKEDGSSPDRCDDTDLDDCVRESMDRINCESSSASSRAAPPCDASPFASRSAFSRAAFSSKTRRILALRAHCLLLILIAASSSSESDP